MLSHNIYDHFGGDVPALLGRYEIFENLLRQLQRYSSLFQYTLGTDTIKAPFQLSNVGIYILCNVIQDCIIDVISVGLLFLSENSHSCLVVRRGDIGDEAHLQAGANALFQNIQILRRLIRGDDNLLFGSVKSFKCMEEFLLRTLFTDDELDIVNKEHVNVSVFLAELGHCHVVAVTDGVDQFICKIFTGDVENLGLRIILQYKMSNRMHQVCLSESHSRIKVKRVVDFTRRFRYCEGGCVREHIISAHDK